MNILIKNARVVDGTGNPWFHSDIAVQDGRISRMERRLGTRADRTIDADGLTVAPGFIDPHCHVEGAIVFRPDMEELVSQGITTEVLGMCGTSPFPDKESYISMCKKVWGGDSLWYWKMFARSPYDWHSLTEFSNLVMSRRPAINVVPFIGLGSILWSVGYRPTTEDEARKLTGAEKAKVNELIRQGLEEGAAGLTTSRDYFPDRFLSPDDYIEPLKIVGEYNRGFFPHTYYIGTAKGISEAIDLARRTKVKLHIAHVDVAVSMNWGNFNRLPEVLGLIDTAREEGIDVTFDVIQNMSYCIRQDILIRHFQYFCKLAPQPPPGVESLEVFRKKYAEEPAYRELVKDTITRYVGLAEQYLAAFYAEHLDKTILIKTGDERLEGKTLGYIARKAEISPRDLFFDIGFGVSPLLARSPDTFVIWPWHHGHPEEDNTVRTTNHPLGMPSTDMPLMDIPIENFYSPSSFGSLSYFYRKALDYGVRMEEAVRKMTSLPARVLGLRDRGMVREGMKADLVIFDPAEYRSNADCYRPRAKASGIRYVMVNGRVIVDDEKPTEERPGEVLLHNKA